ncbi:MAG: glycosyltransferase family 39 protein [Candidatus Diapherotrites archaeon]|nr:glycosyltransferase family 39 protein [Candidatus Diapherotrites archaeon]
MKSMQCCFYAFLLLCLLQFALFFVMSNSMPFFDEGVYLTGSWLYSEGILPYAGFFESKPIGIFFVGAVIFSVFPPLLLTARMLMAVAALVSLALVFFVSKKIFDERAALVASVFFVFLCLVFDYFWFVIEPFVALLILLSVFSYLQFIGKKNMLWLSAANFFIVATVFFKQTAFLIAAFFLLFFLYRELKRQKPVVKGFLFFLKTMVPAFFLIIVFLAFLFYNNLFALFWEYLFGYHADNLLYYSRVNLSLDFLPFFVSIAIPFVLLFLFLLKKIELRPEQRTIFVLLFLWILGSIVMILPLLGCCMHFAPILPALSVFSGFGFFALLKRHLLLKVFAVLVLLSVVVGGTSFVIIFSGQSHSFCELEKVSEIVVENSLPSDKILVLPASPELYFLSQRLPATKALYYLDFIGYSDSFIGEQLELLSRQPPVLVIVFSHDSGFTESNPAIDAFVVENFELKQKIELKQPLYGFYHFALLFEKKQ